MKKLLLTFAVLAAAVVGSYAQISKGSILVGAGSNLNFTSISPDPGDNYSSFQLQGKVGYFFVDNFAGGLRLDHLKEDESGRTIFGIFGRYYLNNVIILGASLGSVRFDLGQGDASSTFIGLEGGYAAFITDNIAVEPTLNLDFISGDFDQTNIGLNVGFSLYFGR